MQVRRDIVAQQGEEAGDGKGLVAVAQDLEVNGVQVEVKGEVGDGGVDRDHEEDSDDTVCKHRSACCHYRVGIKVRSWGNETAYWRCSHGFK